MKRLLSYRIAMYVICAIDDVNALHELKPCAEQLENYIQVTIALLLLLLLFHLL